MKTSTFAERLKIALENRGISAAELSRRSGASEGLISGYKKGEYEPKQRRLDTFAKILDVSIPWLMGGDVPMGHYDGGIYNKNTDLPIGSSNVYPLPQFIKKPRLGVIPCGKPALAVEENSEWDNVPEYITCDFTLKCKGDSMINARIFDGDIVYIRKQDTVENGEIAAVLINDEATLKRVRKFEDHIVLEPANPMFEPLVYWRENMNEVRIIGKAVAFTSQVR